MSGYLFPQAVPEGLPIEPASPLRRQSTAQSYMESLGMPKGLTQQFLEAAAAAPLRIWIVDNSGSMSYSDGKRIMHSPGVGYHTITSSRWEELCDALTFHGALAAHIGAPTEFRLLNPPGWGQPQVVTVGMGGSGSPDAEIAGLKALVKTGPTGRTPLCEQIRIVTRRVEAQADALRRAGQKVVVVIASDGAATDGDIEAAMRPLQHLPVWIVVRLCTDNDDVAQYWNKVDEEIELDMDVLDDLSGEAAEVCEDNPWLCYAAPLHRLREWGCQHKVMDMLDEKALSTPELLSLIELVLGSHAADLPNPQISYAQFEAALANLLASEPLVFDPLRKRPRAWFSVSKLRKKYGKAGTCAVM